MQHDPRFEARLRNLNPNPAKPVGLLQKVGAIAAGIVIFGLALTFSVLFFAVVVAVGGVIWAYLWWKTRELRKVMREAQQAQSRTREATQPDATRDDGIVIEGEVVREVKEDRGNTSRD